MPRKRTRQLQPGKKSIPICSPQKLSHRRHIEETRCTVRDQQSKTRTRSGSPCQAAAKQSSTPPLHRFQVRGVFGCCREGIAQRQCRCQKAVAQQIVCSCGSCYTRSAQGGTWRAWGQKGWCPQLAKKLGHQFACLELAQVQCKILW